MSANHLLFLACGGIPEMDTLVVVVAGSQQPAIRRKGKEADRPLPAEHMPQFSRCRLPEKDSVPGRPNFRTGGKYLSARRPGQLSQSAFAESQTPQRNAGGRFRQFNESLGVQGGQCFAVR